MKETIKKIFSSEHLFFVGYIFYFVFGFVQYTFYMKYMMGDTYLMLFIISMIPMIIKSIAYPNKNIKSLIITVFCIYLVFRNLNYSYRYYLAASIICVYAAHDIKFKKIAKIGRAHV